MPRSILVISLRYLGDLLLTTPLLRSLREGHPQAALDVLVFAGTEGMLEGNPDIREVLTVARGAPREAQAALRHRLWRRYDLAVIAETGDRPHLYGWMAARERAGLLPPEWAKRWWKSLGLRGWAISPKRQARLESYARLARAMGLEWRPLIVAPTAGSSGPAWRQVLGFDPERERYAVLNPAPRFVYKRWHIEGWQALMQWLHGESFRIVLSGGPGEEEREYVRQVLAGSGVPVTDLVGRLRIAQTADLLRHAAFYAGPDTATTHLAAACGTPTLALYGPTDPSLWGPLPARGIEAPYEQASSLQVRGNVSLVQEPSLACVPCQEEGCERHRESRSACLDLMGAARVIAAARGTLRLESAAGARRNEQAT